MARASKAKGGNRIGGGNHHPARNLTPSEQSLLDLLRRPQKIRGDGGREEEITIGEAVQRKTIQSAMNGSVHAQRTLLDRQSETEAIEQARLQENAEYWRTFKASKKKALERWVADGKQEIDFFPHPDDIVIGHDNLVRFRGPFDAEEMAQVRKTMAMREAFLVQAKYEDRPGVLSNEAWVEGGTSGRLLAYFYNLGLPPRLRWDEQTFYRRWWMVRQWRTRREAEKAVQEKWRSIGFDVKRGTTFQPFDRMLKFLLGMIAITGKCVKDMEAEREWQADVVEGEILTVLQTLHEPPHLGNNALHPSVQPAATRTSVPLKHAPEGMGPAHVAVAGRDDTILSRLCTLSGNVSSHRHQ